MIMVNSLVILLSHVFDLSRGKLYTGSNKQADAKEVPRICHSLGSEPRNAGDAHMVHLYNWTPILFQLMTMCGCLE